MKAWMILMLVICVSMIVGQSEATKGPGCHPHGSHHKPRVPVHKYRRGCTIINRCKRAT
ncbi:hypothetical protein EUTSA_v10002869mg [Eutrema salsugineum]|uniref:Uncharacterized protein n=1 Tax=Eutrema salsugineum TaxID=72664 RepID=V4L0F8_EUTSA|nr:hypothetical protein EUTSA_v10002869mg [Eutrema salsugineum]